MRKENNYAWKMAQREEAEVMSSATVEEKLRCFKRMLERWTGTEPDDVFLAAYYAALRTRLEQGLLFGRRRVDKLDRPGSQARGRAS